MWLQLTEEGRTGDDRKPRVEGAGLEARSLGFAEGSGKAD